MKLPPLRSLAIRLTLAFVAIGMAGALLVGFFVGISTQREFDRFVLRGNQRALVAGLTYFYENNGSWQGLDQAIGRINNRRWRANHPAPATVTDAAGHVVYDAGEPSRAGTQLSMHEVHMGTPIEIEGKVVGYLLNPAAPDGPMPAMGAPEQTFLFSLRRAIFLAALAAGLLALLLGALLAHTLTRPIRDLTAATARVAQGDLGYQVEVRTHDELGALTSAFNHMSAELAAARQNRRQMTADVAHDLRTPLSVILGYTEALSDGLLQGTPEMFGTLHHEAQHLNHLIEDLRVLSLADAGELPLDRRPMPPADLISRAEAAYTMQASQQGITLRSDVAPGLPVVGVDSQRMAQVLGNLIGNALRYTPAGGEIVLGAAAEASAVCLSVTDSGRGIAPDALPHIFDRFYRADPARAEAGASGLGLAIAKSIVEAHGGTLSVNSAPGAGAAFTIRLPV